LDLLLRFGTETTHTKDRNGDGAIPHDLVLPKSPQGRALLENSRKNEERNLKRWSLEAEGSRDFPMSPKTKVKVEAYADKIEEEERLKQEAKEIQRRLEEELKVEEEGVEL